MIRLASDYFRDLGRWLVEGWNRFWFTPADPATLSLIRILAGAMLLYTHLVWSLGLNDFFLPTGWISPEAASYSQPDRFAWSYFWLIRSPVLLWLVHVAALVVFAMLTLGLFTRVVAALSFLAAVSYVNRVPGAQFGLDQINVILALYLMVGPSGDCYSLDRVRAARRTGGTPAPVRDSVSANLAIRLIQVHMCVIYFFAGLSKLQGETWWRGDALWGSVANLEYQSLDLTWLATWPLLVAILTHVTVFWELSFCTLVWVPKLRPLVIALAVPVHLGIAFAMGMITFGLVMLIGCTSFVSPRLVRMLLDRSRAGEGRAGGAADREPAGARPQHRRRASTAGSSNVS
ncbi:MAG: HTTM domain-containing protein [Planctomycetia bacterium]|nr:HTTM domain-containing protein [Planctomycetia bacterium]